MRPIYGFIITLIVALLCPLALASCCKGPLCKSIGGDVGACILSPLPVEVANLIPQVEHILTGGSMDWQSELSALERGGISSVVCAVEAVISDLKLRAKAPSASESRRQIEPAIVLGIERGNFYLKSKGVK